MEDRYPYMRFIVGAAQPIAGVIVVLFALGGLFRACSVGGFGGFVSFLVTLIVAGIIYVGVMASVESLRLFIDIEQNTRELLQATRNQPGNRSGGPQP